MLKCMPFFAELKCAWRGALSGSALSKPVSSAAGPRVRRCRIRRPGSGSAPSSSWPSVLYGSCAGLSVYPGGIIRVIASGIRAAGPSSQSPLRACFHHVAPPRHPSVALRCTIAPSIGVI